MKFSTFVPEELLGIPNKKPFVRIFWGEGCGMPPCTCSDGFLLSVSNGKVGIKVTFKNRKEMNKILNPKST